MATRAGNSGVCTATRAVGSQHGCAKGRAARLTRRRQRSPEWRDRRAQRRPKASAAAPCGPEQSTTGDTPHRAARLPQRAERLSGARKRCFDLPAHTLYNGKPRSARNWCLSMSRTTGGFCDQHPASRAPRRSHLAALGVPGHFDGAVEAARKPRHQENDRIPASAAQAQTQAQAQAQGGRFTRGLRWVKIRN